MISYTKYEEAICHLMLFRKVPPTRSCAMRYLLILAVIVLACLWAQQVGPTTPVQQPAQLSLPSQVQAVPVDIAPRGIQSPAEQPSVEGFRHDPDPHIVQVTFVR